MPILWDKGEGHLSSSDKNIGPQLFFAHSCSLWKTLSTRVAGHPGAMLNQDELFPTALALPVLSLSEQGLQGQTGACLTEQECLELRDIRLT